MLALSQYRLELPDFEPAHENRRYVKFEEKRLVPGLLPRSPVKLIRHVSSNGGIWNETDEDVVGITERVPEATVPGIAAGAEVAGKQPLGPLRIKWLDCGAPPHTDMLDESLLAIEIDDGDGAARIALDSSREAVRPPRADDPDHSVLPEEPHRRDPRSLIRGSRQVREERPCEELVQVDAPGPIADHLHHLDSVAERRNPDQKVLPPAVPVGTSGGRTFAEPISLSSTDRIDFRLPATALTIGFGLLASRTRRRGDTTGGQGNFQDLSSPEK
jgi:hypothetical protein